MVIREKKNFKGQMVNLDDWKIKLQEDFYAIFIWLKY